LKRIICAILSYAFVLVLSGCASQEPASVSTAGNAGATGTPGSGSDVALASKLMGKWTGKWDFQGSMHGKFELIVDGVDGNNVKGAANWYDTASGDVKAPLTKASVRDGFLYAEQPNSTSFKVKLNDEHSMSGTWTVGSYSGPLSVSH